MSQSLIGSRYDTHIAKKGTQESCMKRIGEFLREVVKECVFILFCFL